MRNCFQVTILLLVVLTISTFVVTLLFKSYHHRLQSWPVLRREIPHFDDLVSVRKHLLAAYRHARSGQTMQELILADRALADHIHRLDESYFKGKGVEYEMVNDNGDSYSKHVATPTKFTVCPEIMQSPPKAYWHEGGYVTSRCRNGTDVGEMLTVVATPGSCDKALAVVRGVTATYPSLRLVLRVRNEWSSSCRSKLSASGSNVTVVVSEIVTPNAMLWRSLIGRAKTNFVLVAPALTRFDNQSDLLRLMRMLFSTGAVAVGGAVRYPDARWFRGCLQTAVKNYTLKMVDGYDQSYNSCLVCSHLSSPFVVSKDVILQSMSKFDDMCTESVAFMMFFLSIRDGLFLGCPDVMFYVHASSELSLLERSHLLPVAKYSKLNRIILSNSKEHRFSCADIGIGCEWIAGLVLPICCVEEFADIWHFIFDKCAKHGIRCESDAGSLAGHVKFYGVLPWERDMDLLLDVRHFAKMAALKGDFSNAGYRMVVSGSPSISACQKNNTKCGKIDVHTKHWRIEMWPVYHMTVDVMKYLGLHQSTLVLMDGHWLPTYINPGKATRNRYFDDVYKHVEHWMTIRGTNGMNYDVSRYGKYSRCPNPGFHGCLSNYLPEGNLQFQTVGL